MAHPRDVPEVTEAGGPDDLDPGQLAGSVLAIDDDPDIQLVLQFTLEQAGWTPLPALTGEQGLMIAADTPLDAALVDLRLPGLHGADLIPTLRAGSPMPILVITAQTEGTATTAALDAGADDYLTKPFTPRDLIHRLAVQLDAHPPAPIAAGRLSVDPSDAAVRLDGRPLALTRLERRLLVALMAAAGQPLGPNELLGRVWGYRSPGDHRVVAAMIARVQRHLTPRGAGGLLVAEPLGYRLDLLRA